MRFAVLYEVMARLHSQNYNSLQKKSLIGVYEYGQCRENYQKLSNILNNIGF